MQIPALTSVPLWLSEHYWPDLGDGLVVTQAQRTAMVGLPVHWVATIVVPGQQTAFGLFTGPSSRDVELALLAAGPGADRVSAALRVTADAAQRPGSPDLTDHPDRHPTDPVRSLRPVNPDVSC